MSRPASIGSRLAEQKGIGPGFDLLRVVLALAVVAWHCMTVTGRSEHEQLVFVWFPGYAILVMFFALSGFLITASALRLSLGGFLINRSLRIVPALLVEVMLSAFLLGAIFTTLPSQEYFSSGAFWRYFSNVIGWVNYHLPGVFEDHPDTAVNNSLWTVPFEIGCYLIISGFVVAGALRRPATVLLFCGAFLAASLVLSAVDGSGPVWHVVERLFLARGSRLFVGFLMGIAMFLYRDRIPYSPSLAVACALFCFAIAAVGPADWLSLPVLNVMVAPAVVYLTGFIGVSNIPPLPLFSRGDYSYGIYLYGFPLQQTVVSIVPSITPLAVFCAAVPAIVLFAMF